MKTGEVYTMALGEPQARFIRLSDSSMHGFHKGHLVNMEGFAVSPNPSADEEWELVRKPVDFMTALNSGKQIKSEFWAIDDYLITDVPADRWLRLSIKEIKGKWYIE